MADFTNKYNTVLSPLEEMEFLDWAKNQQRNVKGDLYDYDMRGAYKAGATAEGNGHFPDTYKKPNHPTFSDESIYHGKDGYYGGKWSTENGRDVFDAGPANMIFMGPKQLEEYFKTVEPKGLLRLPPAGSNQ